MGFCPLFSVALHTDLLHLCPFLLPVVLVSKGIENIPVFGFGVDLYLGMVRTQVSLAAGLGLSGRHYREPMAGMAAGAACLAFVQVEPAHPDIGPGGSSDHGVVGQTEKRERTEDTDGDKHQGFDEMFHSLSL